MGAGERRASPGPSTHHEDEGPQALSQSLAQQPVADMEHLPAAGHQLLLSTHGWSCNGAGGTDSRVRRASSSGPKRRVAPFIGAGGTRPARPPCSPAR